MENESKNLEFTEQDLKKKRFGERERGKRSNEPVSLVADRWRDRGSLVESFFTHRKSESESERAREREREREIGISRLKLPVIELGFLKIIIKKRKMKKERFCDCLKIRTGMSFQFLFILPRRLPFFFPTFFYFFFPFFIIILLLFQQRCRVC